MIKLQCLTVDHPVTLRIDEVNPGGYRTRIFRTTYSFESMLDELRLLRPVLDSVFTPDLYRALVEEITAWAWTGKIDFNYDQTLLRSEYRFPMLWVNGRFELNGVPVNLDLEAGRSHTRLLLSTHGHLVDLSKKGATS